VTNNGSISGGNGAAGGSGGSGGVGGAGDVFGSQGITGNNGSGGNGGVGIAVTNNNITLVNNGSVKGGTGVVNGNAIEISGTGNVLELRSASNITGNVVSSGSGNTLALGGTTDSSFDVSEIGALGVNKYQGFDSFAKNGSSTWSLTGSTTSARPWSINAGTLLANNTTGSATGSGTVNVEIGGTLGGIGSIAGLVLVQNGAVLDPGNAPGTTSTLSLGSLQLSPGSTTRLNINGTVAGTGYDQVNVSGTAALDGNLDLVFGGFTPLVGDTFTLLTSSGLSGSTFASISSDLGAALVLTVSYTANDVGMGITLAQGEFAPFAGTPNQSAVASNLDTFSTSGLYQPLIDILNSLDASELPGAFDAIAPEELGAMSTFGFANTRNVFTMLGNRVNEIQNGLQYSANGLTLMDDSKAFRESLFAGTTLIPGSQLYAPKVDDKRLGFFVSGQGTFGDVDGDGNADDYDFSTGGLLVGSDYRLTENVAVGVYAGYQGTQSNTQTGSEIKSDSAKFGLYGTYFSGQGSWLSANIGGGLQDYDSERTSVGGKAVGSTSGTEINGQLTYGYDFKAGANKEWTFGPEASVGYTHLWIDGFNESGSAAPLQIQDQSNDSLRSTLAWKVSYDWKLNSGAWTLRPYGRLGWQHEFMDDSQAITARFAGAGGPFTVNTAEQDADSIIAGAGAQMMFSETISAQLGYSAEANSDYEIHSINGSLNFRF